MGKNSLWLEPVLGVLHDPLLFSGAPPGSKEAAFALPWGTLQALGTCRCEGGLSAGGELSLHSARSCSNFRSNCLLFPPTKL